MYIYLFKCNYEHTKGIIKAYAVYIYIHILLSIHNIYYILSVALYSKFSKCSMRIAVLHSIGMCFTGQSKKLI